MVGAGLFCFHLFFFVRPRHNEASGPGMRWEGSERVNIGVHELGSNIQRKCGGEHERQPKLRLNIEVGKRISIYWR